MKKNISLLALALCTIISTTSVNAATGYYAETGTYCGTGFITTSNTAPPGSFQGSVNIKANHWALVLMDGFYCGISEPTPGEASLIRVMATRAKETGKEFTLKFNANGVKVYTPFQ